MSQQKKLTIITGNQNKVVEFERLLDMPLEHVKLDLPEIQATDVREVCRVKAQAAYNHLRSPVFVDDTGLTIEEWGELPGALIKWFMDNVGNEGILHMLQPSVSRKARVTTALGYCDENGVRVFVGELHGEIADEPRGENGFGYDVIFIPDSFDQTFAQMSNEEKDRISMRAVATQALKEYLTQ